MRILLAEDDLIIADGLCRALKKAGYAVDHVRRLSDQALCAARAWSARPCSDPAWDRSGAVHRICPAGLRSGGQGRQDRRAGRWVVRPGGRATGSATATRRASG